MNYMFTNKNTVAFDLYGDISILNNDIKVNTDLKAIIQVFADFLKTNKGDYEFYDAYGSDYDSFIGKGITPAIINTIQQKIKVDLDRLQLIPPLALEVAAIQTNTNSIEVRVFLYDIDDYTIYINISKDEGMLIDY